jgi:uncharacterized membrane protein YbaN (DUF454 family)
MNARFKRIGIYWLGWFFIVLGILGLFLPILQGILFLLVGLSLLSQSSPWAARLLQRLRERFPRIAGTYSEAMAKARDLQVKMFKKKKKAEEFD